MTPTTLEARVQTQVDTMWRLLGPYGLHADMIPLKVNVNSCGSSVAVLRARRGNGLHRVTVNADLPQILTRHDVKHEKLDLVILDSLLHELAHALIREARDRKWKTVKRAARASNGGGPFDEEVFAEAFALNINGARNHHPLDAQAFLNAYKEAWNAAQADKTAA